MPTTLPVDFGPLYRAYMALEESTDMLLDRDVDAAGASDLAAKLAAYAEAHIALASQVNSNDAIDLHDRGAGQALIAVALLLSNPNDTAWAGYIGSAQAQYEKMFGAMYGAHPLNDADSEVDPGVVGVTFE